MGSSVASPPPPPSARARRHPARWTDATTVCMQQTQFRTPTVTTSGRATLVHLDKEGHPSWQMMSAACMQKARCIAIEISFHSGDFYANEGPSLSVSPNRVSELVLIFYGCQSCISRFSKKQDTAGRR